MVLRHFGWSAIAVTTVLTQGAIAATPEVPSVLKVLPSDAAGVILLNAEAQAWEKLAQFPLFGPEMTVPGFLFTPLLAEDTTQFSWQKPKRPVAILNFDIDILPWLGDRVAYAVLPDGNPIAIAAVKDPSKTPAYFTRLQTSRKSKPTLLTYNNAQIIAWAPQPIKPDKSNPFQPAEPQPTMPGAADKPHQKPLMTPGFALAYLPGTQSHIIIAPTVDILKNLLDRQKNTSFSQNPDLQKTIADPRFASALAVGFGDYQAFLASSKKAAESSPFGAFPTLQLSGVLKQLEDGYGNANAFLTATDQGMQFEGNLGLKPTISPEALALLKSTDTKSEILNRIPAITYGFANGNNLAFPMGKVLDTYNQDKQTKVFLDGARKFAQSFLGIDDRDILPWMDREYAMFAFPTEQGFFAKQLQTDIGLGVLIQTSNRPLAEAGLKKIQTSLVGKLGKGATIGPRDANNILFTSVNTADSKSVLAYSWVAEDTVLIVSGFEAADRLVPKPWKNLADSPTFKEAIAPLPKDNAGYFYIDGSSTAAFFFNSLMPKFMGSTAPENAPPAEVVARGSSIRHVVGTSLVRQDNVQIQAIMQLGRVARSPVTAKSLLEKSRVTDQVSIGTEEGIRNLSRAIALDPSLGEAYFQRALLRVRSFDYAGALGDLNEASSRNFKSPFLAETRGIAYYNLHDYEKAIVDLKPASEAEKPFSAEDLGELLFNSYMQMGDYKMALTWVDRQIEGDGILAVNLFQRCDVKTRMGDFKAALEDCESGLTMVREANQATLKDAEQEIATQLKAKVITKEEAEMRRQLLVEDTVPLLAQRCYARAAVGVSTALQECEALIEADAENARAFEYLGLGRSALKQPGNAKQAYGQAIALYEAMDNQVAVKRVEALLKQLPR